MFETLKTQFKMARMTSNAYVSMIETKLGMNEKAEAPIQALLGLFVVAILAGALIPTAINTLTASRNASWTTSELAMYGIISIMVLVGVVMLLIRIATD